MASSSNFKSRAWDSCSAYFKSFVGSDNFIASAATTTACLVGNLDFIIFFMHFEFLFTFSFE